MTPTIETYWRLLSVYCEILNKHNVPISIREEKKTAYCDAVKKQCKEYKSKYMSSNTSELDRHKVAAIMVVEGLERDVIDSSKIDEQLGPDTINIGAEKVLLVAALDFITATVNQIFEKEKEKNPGVGLERFPGFVLPDAWSCDTEFINIMSRTLYYARRDYQLNEMELAEKFFILEYGSILERFPNDKEKYFQVLKKAGTKKCAKS
ncbi:MAG: hypothetical protein LIO95_03365 [Clostridiales bacterium]|nr:hypothetical protein [Clostridiales bacterium]